ncbi:MAG: cation diffusion facilitator family transporter [Treponema sp.]|nr:cation diffusion facilitator family transporter [Treponema sp.]
MERNKAQVTEGVVSVVVNAVLFGVKFWAGFVTGSLAIMADAWHTLSDSLTSVFVIITVKLSSKKADKEHPFGHGRWEPISSVFMAVVLGIIAYEFVKNSITRLSNRESVEYGTLAIAVTIASIVAKELMAQYAFYIGRKTNNSVVKADGWHHRSDALSSIVVLAGIIFSLFFGDKVWWIDSILGILVALALFYATIKILKEAITVLLGEEPDKELEENITTYIKAIYRDDLQLHHLHIHNYISQKELTMHIKLDKNLSIERGHQIATEIENMINADFGIIATIHVEPLHHA